MKSNAEYRYLACNSLKGHWAKAVVISLIFLAITCLSSSVDYFAFNSDTTKFFEGFNFLYTALVLLPATFALLVVYLRLIRYPEINLIQSFFNHFVSNYGRAVVSMLVLAIIASCFAVAGLLVSVALASVPFSLLNIPFNWISITEINSIYWVTNIFNSLSLLIYVLLIGILFMLSIIPMLMYIYKICLFPYIIEDNPNSGIRDAYHHSKVLMAGHRKQLFLLDLSFIGWYLLGLITFGIALLWVIPYQQTARAHFYNDLKEAYDKTQYLTIH